MTRIAIIPGDGIGKEVIPAAVRLLQAAAHKYKLTLDLHTLELDADSYLETGVALPQHVFEDLRDHHQAILLGALGDPRVPDSAHARDILLGLRQRLDLYINLRPARLVSTELCPLKDRTVEDINFVVFRENTEGLYTGIQGTLHTGSAAEVATQHMVCTYRGVKRIQAAAFRYAQERNQRLCMVDKSNALRAVGDLWLRVFRELCLDFPDVEARHLYVDAAAMQLVRDPSQFDVIVTGNLFGDILSDLAAQLVGGMGLAASANIHPGKIGLFEPVHGSAPDIAGQGVANPVASFLSVGLMLDHLGHREAANDVERAVRASLLAGHATPDLGGSLSTDSMTDHVIAQLA